METTTLVTHPKFGRLDVIWEDGKVWFPATACARVLGYAAPEKAIRTRCKYLAKREVPHPQNPSKTLMVTYIPEGDLYRLILGSRLPAAEAFERWVMDEVLPTIRQTGGYGVSQAAADDIAALSERVTSLEARVRRLSSPRWDWPWPDANPLPEPGAPLPPWRERRNAPAEARPVFARQFRQALHDKGCVSNAAAARLLDTREMDTWRWANGKGVPRLSRIPGIAAKLGVTVDFLFGLESDEASGDAQE